jgi:hypothetical protein
MVSDMDVQERAAHLDTRTVRIPHTATVLPDRARVSVRLAVSGDELTAIYKFRYSIYVEELRLAQFYANHVKRTIEDPLDAGAYNFYASDGTAIAGVLRFNTPRDSDISYYEHFLDMKSAGHFHPDSTSISTRLMVAQHLRGSNVAFRLCQAGYRFGLLNSIRYNFLDCNENMTGFFERLGYVVQGRAEHPEYGVGDVMRLDLLDRAHLSKICSPLLARPQRIRLGDRPSLANA